MLHKNYLWFNVRRRNTRVKEHGESKKIRTKLLYLDESRREWGAKE